MGGSEDHMLAFITTAGGRGELETPASPCHNINCC